MKCEWNKDPDGLSLVPETDEEREALLTLLGALVPFGVAERVNDFETPAVRY